MTDMQKNIRTLLKESTGRKALLLYIFAAVIALTGLIMYYAAALTLNALFAGSGNMYVSLIALACAFGAAAGIFLFNSIFNGIRLDMEDRFMETLEQTMDEQNQEELYPLMDDAVHFQMEGIMQSGVLLIRDIIRIIIVTVLDYRCALIMVPGFVIHEFLFKKMAEKKIVSAEKFVLDLHLIPQAVLAIVLSAVLIFALFEMKNGRLGLYGVIMMLFMFMDLVRDHAHQSYEILGLRKDLRSLELLDTYMSGSPLPVYEENETVCDDSKPYIMKAVSFAALTICIIMYVYAVCSILGYRSELPLRWAAVMMIASSLAASVCHAYAERGLAEKKEHILLRKAASGVVSLISLLYALRVNALLAGILASAFAADQILVPLILDRSAAPYETRTDERIRGLVHMICLTLIIFAGVMLYWNAMASFAQVLMISALYMAVYMQLDGKGFASEKQESTDER